MSQWQQQIIANANAIQALIDNSKKISQLPALAIPLTNADKFAIELDATGQTVYASIADLNLATFNPSLGGTSKGDLLVYDGADWINIGAGTNGYILSSNSATATGLEWVLENSTNGLQEVTDIGNTTTNTIRVAKLEIDTANTYLDTVAGKLNIWNSTDIHLKNYTNNIEVQLSWQYGVGIRTGGT